MGGRCSPPGPSACPSFANRGSVFRWTPALAAATFTQPPDAESACWANSWANRLRARVHGISNNSTINWSAGSICSVQWSRVYGGESGPIVVCHGRASEQGSGERPHVIMPIRLRGRPPGQFLVASGRGYTVVISSSSAQALISGTSIGATKPSARSAQRGHEDRSRRDSMRSNPRSLARCMAQHLGMVTDGDGLAMEGLVRFATQAQAALDHAVALFSTSGVTPPTLHLD